MAQSTDLSLRLSFWFLNHKDQLRKWWVLIILFVDVLLLAGWIVVGLVTMADGQSVQKLAASRTQTVVSTAPILSATVADLVVSTPRVLTTGDKRVALAVELTNPNELYQAESVRYRFKYGTQEFPIRTATVLPDSRRFVFEANVTLASENPAASLEIIGVRWRRPNDPSLFSRLTFTQSDVSFDTSATTASIPPTPAPRLKATLTNKSIFSFRVVDVSVGIFHQNQLVAVEQFTLRDWLADTSRNLDVQWLFGIPADAQPVIVPQVNLLDTDNRIRN